MIHYLYSTFYEATQTGVPLMRTMWMEFPDDADLQPIASQFMLGDSMLVAPKINAPDEFLDSLGMQVVDYMLPQGYTWYNYYSKKTEASASANGLVSRNVPDLEQVVYIKGGSVLPILLHDNCMALTKCISNKIRLEVYLDSDSKASGQLYTDDGVSFKHETDAAYALVYFTWDSSSLNSARVSDDSKYSFPGS
mmetsp:Transcript_8344/g.10143  ORF Transcript_8344/g.10143 Transcript_8344/m.10143 type:complete len:194 (+) Transcript_8344:2267-2848(+)